MKIKRYLILIVLFFLFVFSFPALGIEEYDLGISSEDIWFSKSEFFAGEKVKIYAQVHNYGKKDVSAYVIFYQDQTTIGEPQPISVVAGGTDDAVWVDWLAVDGDYEIIVRIVGQSPADVIENNDAITIPVAIEEDNDDDGVGNSEDMDDDNDGLPDEAEEGLKTNPLNPDTDGDGVIDSEDDYPLDKNKSKKEQPKEEKSEFVNSLSKSKVEEEEVKEVRNEGEVPFFEFESEKANELKERQNQAVLTEEERKEETEKTGGEAHPNKTLWLLAGLMIGLLIYFSPQIVRAIRRSNGRKKRTARTKVKK